MPKEYTRLVVACTKWEIERALAEAAYEGRKRKIPHDYLDYKVTWNTTYEAYLITIDYKNNNKDNDATNELPNVHTPEPLRKME